MRWVPLVVGVLAVAAGTWWGAWYAPAAWGVVAGMTWPRSTPAWHAGLAAAAAWGLLLLAPWVAGAPLGAVATRVGGVLGAPASALPAATLAFAALMAASSAHLASRLAPRRG